MGHEYRVVDVFADRKYTGNQLTVVLDAEDLDAKTMQAMARETNHSETVFLTSTGPIDGAWPARYFTPKTELPFAGHPTLGTAHVVASEYGAGPPVVLSLRAGRIPVEPRDDLYWMTQPEPTVGPEVPRKSMAKTLGLDPQDVSEDGPVEVISTGIPFHVVPLVSLEAARKARLDLDALRQLRPDDPSPLVLVFCDETVDVQADVHVRCFTGAVGPEEDPATGSAAGCLAAWLLRHRKRHGAAVDVTAEQGVELGRPSRLRLHARRTGAGMQVSVGGNVVNVARGTFL